MTTSTNIFATAGSDRSEADRAVTRMLSFSTELQQATLARMVAATICEEPDSALERFASTGKLDATAILDELNHVRVPFEQEAWVDALARFALFDKGPRHD